MLNRMTDRARRVIEAAAAHADRLQHTKITAPHVFLSLLDMTHGTSHAILQKLVADRPQFRAFVEARLQGGGQDSHDSVARVVEIAAEQARQLNHNYIGTEHLLLAVLETEPRRRAARQLLEGIVGPFMGSGDPAVLQPGPHAATFLGTSRKTPVWITQLCDRNDA